MSYILHKIFINNFGFQTLYLLNYNGYTFIWIHVYDAEYPNNIQMFRVYFVDIEQNLPLEKWGEKLLNSVSKFAMYAEMVR